MTHREVAILIVTYNSATEIGACLQSTKQADASVLVIDNASADNTATIVSDLGFPLLANARNIGFAAAVNQGVRATTAPFLLLLNPDAILQTGILALTAQCMTTGTGAVGGRLVSDEGLSQTGFNVRRFPTPGALFLESVLINRIWPTNPINWRFRCLDLDLTKPAQVEQPAGAFLLFRREAWNLAGGFDEGFSPLWFEDVDFCKRISESGFRIFYCPDAVAVHRGAHSISQLDLGTRTEYWYRSLLRYSILHFRTGGRIITGVGVATGSLLRVLLGGSNYRSRRLVRSHFEVMKLAIRSMWTRKLKSGEPYV